MFIKDSGSTWKASGRHLIPWPTPNYIVIFLRSELNAPVLVPPRIARYFEGQKDSELRHAGRKYIKMARRLDSIGSVLWLPLDVPFSIYDRYVNINDEDIFSHLKSICSGAPNRDEFVRNLVLGQLKDASLPLSYHNLFVNYADLLADSDILLLLLEALGGQNIPDTLLRSVNSPQRRWEANGEIKTTDATQFGLPVELVNVLSDNNRLAQSLTVVTSGDSMVGGFGIAPLENAPEEVLSEESPQARLIASK
ncbi:hypothetical protein CEP54_014447 [Fusarium duplospermum]|uniref:Uncharacterized protein n=1 Tax=Fusarium duplospermum TaxID=1325734 RepID=A0A428NW17_9HYPO|nr:hypothetical protein CEP54_014447 [Fusarium duplospermum]